ncbi:hypothetical protein GA0061101_12590 [Rhizobium lusitanum]|jgi:hypothetical protein|uniref:Uncharacterized protein n=1 Tax=Rhizobium lusitanum TaxID=293958 RepID=A0A1C3X5M7_9HYPH|nr:hypothetical protein GA0061101_12590 [Rhizobium lusitanum]
MQTAIIGPRTFAVTRLIDDLARMFNSHLRLWLGLSFSSPTPGNILPPIL